MLGIAFTGPEVLIDKKTGLKPQPESLLGAALFAAFHPDLACLVRRSEASQGQQQGMKYISQT